VRIELSLERVKIVLRCCEVERFLAWNGVGLFRGNSADWDRSRTELLDVPAGAIRYSRLLAMPIEPTKHGSSSRPAPGLLSLVKEARKLQHLVDEHRDKSLPELAKEIDCTAWRFARVLRLNYLAPDIIASILDGTQPLGLTRHALVHANLPMDWSLQRKLFGFPDRATLEGSE
jgi:site-specific DNA recombinase